jgi:formate dehydrogenase subunit gamma
MRGSDDRTAVTTTPPDVGEHDGHDELDAHLDRVERFAAPVRVLHWATAVLVLVLLFTGASLYAGPLSTLVGRRALVKQVHIVSGLLLPLPLLGVLLRGRWRRAALDDARRLDRFDAEDRRWLAARGRDPSVRLGKFNPGQKLNAAVMAGALPVMFGTGLMLWRYEPFSDAWRTGATFVHDWTFLLLSVLVIGHIVLAVGDRDALRGMVRGWVPSAWARSRRPAWWEEQERIE